MDHLRQENFSECYQQLNRAQDLLRFCENSSTAYKLLAITHNNLGCYYRKQGKLKLAAQYLQKALNLDVLTSVDRTNLAGTNLNLCAIYSQVKKHEQALQHAITALQLLKDVYDHDGPNQVINTLVLALHNTAVEYEFLNDLRKAEETYRCGVDIAQQKLGPTHPLTQSLIKSLNALNHQKTKKLSSTGARYVFKHKTKDLDNTLPKIKTSSAHYTKGKRMSLESSLKGSNIKTPKKLDRSMDKEDETFSNNRQLLISINMARNSSGRPPVDKSTYKRGRSVPKDILDANLEFSKIEEKFSSIQAQINNFEHKYKSKSPTAAQQKAHTISFDENPKMEGPKTPKEKLQSRVNAATVIQKRWRGHQARKFYKNNQAKLKAIVAVAELDRIKQEAMLEKKQSSMDNRQQDMVKMGTHVENKFLGQDQKKKTEISKDFAAKNIIKLEKTKESPVKRIQKPPQDPALNVQMSRIKRSMLRPIKEEDKRVPIVIIQSEIRKFLVRKRFLKLKAATIKIQKNIRRVQCNNLYKSIISAVIFIQRFWRKYKPKI